MFGPEGPSLRELAVQALSSVEHGYDLLAPKFDHTPFRTPGRVLDAVAVLALQPGIGRPGRVPGTRELVVGKTRYLVPYRVRGEVVEVLRVFHTSRRPPKRW